MHEGEASSVHDGRPSPDALLKQASRVGRGRLKIFLGAAPGVGKTYEMLASARSRREEGQDVVVGVVETHGRSETAALTEGFETLPRRRVTYRGRVLDEMDVDAVLARRPQLVLVDELAHTNAPGSRHPKRYLDVEELLDAGIDVFTTVNIQHLESLNDIIAKITHVRVRETVPDSIIDQADDIELIDLTPEDLIERLRAGKIYVPDAAQRALNNYFTPHNLTALRELALRRTAQRVNAQMVDYMRSHAITGPWLGGDRILVCVAGLDGKALVRQARRLADRLRAPWTALHIDSSVRGPRDEATHDAIAEALALAGRLGADVVTLPGEQPADDILAYARENNFTHVMLGRSTRRYAWPFQRSTVDQLTRTAGDLNVLVVADTASAEEKAVRRRQPMSRSTGADWKAYVFSLLFVGVALGSAIILKQALAVANLALAFLVAVLASAVAYGLVPSLVACLASVLAYNFFFLPPVYTFTIADPENVVTLACFAVVAVIASNLAARVRAQAIAARQRARLTEELYAFSRKLTGTAVMDEVLWIAAYQVAAMLKVRVVIMLPDAGRLQIMAGFPPEDELDGNDLAAAQWCFEHGQEAGRGADTLPGAKRLFIPLRTLQHIVGVVGIDRDDDGLLLDSQQARLLNALLDQAALAIQRVNLAAEIDRAKLSTETEKLRSALLTSISHDLRTPLASILGAATSLASHGAEWDSNLHGALVDTIREESERLNRFIGNLLDMTRLEAGPLEPHLERADVAEVIGAALRRARQILAGHRVKLTIAPDLPMVSLDMVLLEQVLFNLLDNAAKYTPEGSAIDVGAQQVGDVLRIEILDEGEGLPQGDLERIFDKFYRIQRTDRRPAGTGLGLAICRGFVEAMHGAISARNRTDRKGSCFRIDFPLARTSEPPVATSMIGLA
jgi:two-component system sensor histidine kinase KdpD